MTHVLFLPKWYPNEYDWFDGNFIENHAHAIKKIALVSVIFVHSEETDQHRFRIEEKENDGILEIRVFYKKPHSGIAFFDKIRSFFRFRKAQQLGYSHLLEKRTKPDLCHVHVLSRPALLALDLKSKFNIPFIITEHWSGYLPVNGAYAGFLKKRFTEYIVSKASYIHTVSTQLKEAMQKHRLKGKYVVIPNVVDENLFIPQQGQHDKIEIIYVGNLLQRPKKIFDIIKAMQKLKAAGIDFHLSIYGEGKDEAEAIQLSQSLRLEAEISFCGTENRAGIAQAMAQSDFLILFSEFENQPCVISEAQACGLPLILPNLPGIAELMNEELGILVPTGDREAFENALIEMAQNYTDYAKEKIRAYALKTFSEESIAQQFDSLYQKVLKA